MHEKDAQDLERFCDARDALKREVENAFRPMVEWLAARPWLFVPLVLITLAMMGCVVFNTVAA